MASSSRMLSVFTLTLLVLSHTTFAERMLSRHSQQQQGQFQQTLCRIHNLNPLEPNRRQQHEAGVTEQWDQNNQQLECAGVAATRHLIEPKGLLLPNFHNAPMLVYVLQGRGVMGVMIPGCPETFQSVQSEQELRRGGAGFESSRSDQHQKLHFFRQGDIIALPAGISHWCYNDGNENLVVMVVHDTSNYQNQLDQNLRRFFLAGNQPEQQGQKRGLFRHGQESQQESTQGNNIFQAFDEEILAESFGVQTETIRKLQGQNDNRGTIVRVEKELGFIRPRRSSLEEGVRNGLEETLCSMRIRENIADPERVDVYSAQGGQISTINSHNLPILRNVQLSAEKGLLYRNAMVAPYWNINAHSLIYVIRGSGRLQIVGNSNSNKAVFDGELREGQLIVVPQNFAVVKEAGNEGFEWIAFKTNDNAMVSTLAGKTSVMRAMPEEVLMNAYQVSRDEARRLKFNRQEVTILSPRSRSRSMSSAVATAASYFF